MIERAATAGQRARPPFVGRATELTTLETAIAAARAGHPRLVLVEGAAGVGKTALIEQLVASARGLRVLRGSGEERERSVALGLVDQVLRQSETKTPGADAREQVLESLLSRQAVTPLVLVLEDAHWADPESLEAIVFAFRRLGAARVAVIAASRRGADLAGIKRLADSASGDIVALGALAAEDLRALADRAGTSLTVAAAQRLLVHTAGNVRDALAMLSELPVADWHDLDHALGAPQALVAEVTRTMETCSAPTRRLVEAASVLGPSCLLAEAAALGEVADSLLALDEAETAGLLLAGRCRGLPTVGFPAPVVGAAVRQGLRPLRAAHLHEAAAARTDDECVALGHRAAAAVGPDEALAARFEELAGRSEDRSAAATALVSASRLSPERATREDRLLRAVDWMLLGGDAARARGFAAEVAACAPAARRDSVLGGLAFTGDRVDEAAGWLRSAWEQCDVTRDRPLAATIAHRQAFYALIHLRDDEVAAWASHALELAPDDPLASEWTATLALSRWRQGDRREAYALLEAACSGDAVADAHLIGMDAWLRIAADELEGVTPRLAAAAQTELRHGANEIGVVHLNVVVRAHFEVGAWDEAVAVAGQAVALISRLQDVSARVFAWWAATLVPAARGDWDTAQALVRNAAAEPTDAPDRIVAVSTTQALLAAARGHADTVLELLAPITRITPSAGVDDPGFWPWQHLYADALVATARFGEADAFLTRHEALAARRAHRTASARLSVARGRLESGRGDRQAAGVAFAQALDLLDAAGRPYELALAQLAHGQHLRREGRRRASADLLAAAAETFTTLGAAPALARAEREMTASGLRPSRRGSSATGQLTPQELTVARLVVSGRANRQVAAELQLSVKTVEVHLTRIYAKLGISSRTQLAHRLPDGETYAGAS